MVPHGPKRRKLGHGGPTSPANDERSPSYVDDSKRRIFLGPSEMISVNGPPNSGSTTKENKEMGNFTAYSGESYKSRIFKLQMDEMLADVQINPAERPGRVDNALQILKSSIEGIEEKEALSVHEALGLMLHSYKIIIPFPDPIPQKSAAHKISYTPPADVNVVGSYSLEFMLKTDHKLGVDLVVTMPASLFQEKDHFNYGYFYKRAYYVAFMASGLQTSVGDIFDFKFGYLGGNDLQPVLVATLRGDETALLGPRFQAIIIPAAPEYLFNGDKLYPTEDSIRSRAVDDERTKPSPTPFYNATLRMDCNFGRYLKLLRGTSKKVDGFREACILGRIWLRQRGLGGDISKGGFGNFEWAALMALLLQGGSVKGHSVLSPGYSGYQLFKGLIRFLSSNDLVARPFLFQASIPALDDSESPVFFDGPRSQNLLFKMTPSSYAALREEAKVSIEMLNDETFDQFEAAFILKKDHPLQEFDLFVKVPLPKSREDRLSMDHSNPFAEFTTKLYKVLREGLKDRVKLVHINVPEVPLWSLRASSSYVSSIITVGIVFDSANVHRLVDYGPAAEDKRNAARFRKFWGEKADLRRFKDGSILESVVWPRNAESTVVKDIVAYLLRRHFDADLQNTKYFGDSFRHLLPLAENGTKAFGKLIEGMRSFEQKMRSMDGLPLQLKQISASSPQLRYSSLIPPILGTPQTYRNPADIIIQLEGSGRWPDDIAAIQTTKIAFLLKIGNLLESSVDGLVTRLGIENSGQTFVNLAFLDVSYPNGPSFRLRIHNERESTLLDRQSKDKLASLHSRENAARAQSAYALVFVQGPLHTQSVSTLCTRFPLLSCSIRLLKKWFESHMLSGHFREEVVELLAVRTFLQPYPWQAPSSSTTALLRTLQFMSRWNWRTTPLVVDFNGTMTSNDVDAIQTRLEAWRKIDPGMNRTIMLAASNHDITGTAFTTVSPSKVVAARMTSLARSACALMTKSGLELDPTALFKSTTDDYDFVIHLSPEYTALRIGGDNQKPTPFKNLEMQAKNHYLMVGYEPTRVFLDEISTLYADCIVFFYDKITNTAIAGIWNPETFSRPFKVNTPYATKPLVSKSAQLEAVEVDRFAILSEIARIGGSIISRIEIHK